MHYSKTQGLEPSYFMASTPNHQARTIAGSFLWRSQSRKVILLHSTEDQFALTVAAPVDQHGLSVVLRDETREAQALAVRDHSDAL